MLGITGIRCQQSVLTALPELNISQILGVEPKTLLEKDYPRDFIPLWSFVSFFDVLFMIEHFGKLRLI